MNLWPLAEVIQIQIWGICASLRVIWSRKLKHCLILFGWYSYRYGHGGEVCYQKIERRNVEWKNKTSNLKMVDTEKNVSLFVLLFVLHAYISPYSKNKKQSIMKKYKKLSTYLYLNHFAVYLKLTQWCRSTIFQ